MEFIKKYWSIILFLGGLISTTTAAQIQIATNKQDIADNKTQHNNATAKVIVQLTATDDAIKLQAEKDYLENKKEIEKIKAEQKQNTEIKINQNYLREDMQELKEGFKEILNELRAKP